MDKLLAAQERQRHEMTLKKNMLVLRVLTKAEVGESSGSDEAEFQDKIYRNIAIQFGKAARKDDEERFLTDCAIFCCQGIHGFIERIQLTKKKIREDPKQN